MKISLVRVLCVTIVSVSLHLSNCSVVKAQPGGQASDSARRTTDVWLGTGSRKPGTGIYHCLLDPATGKLTEPTLVAEVQRPGFLAMHPKQPVLYAVGAIGGTPLLLAYRITGTGDDAGLELINTAEIGDGGAAHVAVDQTGKTVLTAQYGGGSVAAFKIAEDGAIIQRTALIDHEGASKAVAGRQDASHAHWVGFSPDNRFAFVPDLGLDKVVIYRHDAERSSIQPSGFAVLPAGAGPRHMKFHPNGRWVYVLHELDLKVTAFDYDSEAGTMEAKQTIETVPRDLLAKEKFKSCSEIRVHPTGKFVYAANRGHDTITAFSVDQQDGTLTLIEREHIRGATPRNFNVDPSGRWLLAAGQDSDTLASFEVNPDSGELAYNRSLVTLPSCICVLFQHE